MRIGVPYLFFLSIIGVSFSSEPPAVAQVQKRNLVTEVVGNTLGGALKCAKANQHELNVVQCGTQNISIDQVIGLNADFDHATETILFQEIAQRSLDASQCQLEFFNAYKTDPSISERLDDEAFSNFSQVFEPMAELVRQRDDLIEQNRILFQGNDPQDHSEAQHATVKKIALNQEEINKTNVALKFLASNVPMGDRREVLEALISEVRKGRVDLGSFKKSFHSAMGVLQSQMKKSEDFYLKRRTSDGSFKIDDGTKQKLMRSGQVDILLSSIDPDGELKKGLQCRLNAYYEKGPDRAEMASAAALMAVPFVGETGAAFLVSKAGLQATSLGVRALYFGSEVTSVVGAGAGAAQVVSQIGGKCFGPTYFSSANRICEPTAQLNGILAQSNHTECAGAVLMSLPAFANYKAFFKVTRASMKVAGAKTNQVLGPGGLKSVGERLTQKPLPGRVNAAFKIGTDERVIVARLHEMGLDEESNFLRGSKDVKNRTELSRLVDEIRTRYGVEIYGRPQGQARAIDIYERTDKKVGVNFGQPALQDPAQAVAELRDLKEKLGEIEELEKVGVIVVDKTDFVLWGTSDLKGNPLVSKLGKTIDKASAHGEKFYADKDQLRDAEAAGIASWKGIGLDTKGMVKNPNRAVGTGLHEIKHRSTDSKEILDRNINFSSESKSLPESTTHQYKDYFRSDELEARLPQLAHYRGVRLSGDRSLASSESWQAKNAFAFVKAQRKIIREIQAKQTLPTHAPDGWKYVVNVDGKPVDVSLPDNWGKLKFDPNAVLKKRLEVLDKLESHLLKYYEPSGSFKPVVPR